MNQSTCSIDGCEKRILARGWCSAHYSRWKRWGSPHHIEKRVRYCTIEGCDRPRTGGGLCGMHYLRKKRGTPNAENPGPLRVYAEVCKLDGCGRDHARWGYCIMHAERVRKNGSPGPVVPLRIPGRTCSEPGCNDPHHANGWCAFHNAHVDSVRVRTCTRCGGAIDMLERSPSGRKRHGSTLMCRSCMRARTTRAKYSAKAIAARAGSNDCTLCGDAVDLSLRFPDPFSGSVDHIVPVARGGSNEINNLQLAHLVCNMRKGSRVPEELAT